MLEAATSRELILARIEEALSDTHPQLFEATATQTRAVLPAVHDLVPQFAANAEFLACAAEAAAKAELAAKHGWKKVASHRGMLTDALVRSSGFSPLLHSTDGYDHFKLEACDALIAQTGSSLSVLPGHHIVLARRD